MKNKANERRKLGIKLKLNHCQYDCGVSEAGIPIVRQACPTHGWGTEFYKACEEAFGPPWHTSTVPFELTCHCAARPKIKKDNSNGFIVHKSMYCKIHHNGDAVYIQTKTVDSPKQHPIFYWSSPEDIKKALAKCQALGDAMALVMRPNLEDINAIYKKCEETGMPLRVKSPPIGEESLKNPTSAVGIRKAL